MRAQALAFELDAVRVVNDTVENGVGERGAFVTVSRLLPMIGIGEACGYAYAYSRLLYGSAYILILIAFAYIYLIYGVAYILLWRLP
jgi:hypothetical protein